MGRTAAVRAGGDRHEAAILLALLRDQPEEAARLASIRAPEPDRFLALAAQCDVRPWLHAALQRLGRLDMLGPAVRAGLEEARRRCRADNLLLLARLEQALDLLLGAGVVPVVLKGLDVIHRLDVPFDARATDDADLLVRPADVSRVLERLEVSGWRAPPEPARTHWLRSSYEMPLWSRGPVPVLLEIHWSLGQARRYTIPTEELLARSLPLDIAGRQARRLDPHDAVSHLFLHHLQHYFDRRLKWALDMRLITAQPGFSWSVVAERLEAWGGRAAAGMALVHLAKLFPALVPAEARALLPAAAWRRVATAPLLSSHPLDLFRGTRRRWVQLWLAAALYEDPIALPGYLRHRRVRDEQDGAGPGPSPGPGNDA